MDKVYRNIISFVITAGLLFWFVAAIWDKFVLFPDMPFWTILLYDVPTHIFYRPTVVVFFVIFGIITSLLLKIIRDSESRYQQLIENINDAVFIKPATYSGAEKYAYVNDAACKMLGYTREELLQLSTQNIIDPDRLGDFAAQMEILRNEGHALFETVFLKKDGSKVPVEVNAHVFHFKGEPFSLAIVQDISASLAAKEALRESGNQLSILYDQLIKIREEEKGRISKELHDQLGQNLMFLKMQISSIQKRLPLGLSGLRRECGKLLEHLDEIVENVMRLIQDLRPQELKEMGFSLAANLLIKESCELYGIKSHAIDMDEIDDWLPPEAQLNLYRIIQESLTNIGKHAQATEVSVAIKKPGDQILIRIKDNGKGYDLAQPSVEKKGLGLSIIKERTQVLGGQLKIQSHPGKGTENILIIPLNRMAQGE